MVYMNISLINWYSKWQSIIETSVFGAEFVAMKVKYDLSSYIYGDNMSFIYKTSKQESTLRKSEMQLLIMLLVRL